jgi:hypothetical protein
MQHRSRGNCIYVHIVGSQQPKPNRVFVLRDLSLHSTANWSAVTRLGRTYDFPSLIHDTNNDIQQEINTKRDWLVNGDNYFIMHLEGAHGWRIEMYYVQTHTYIHRLQCKSGVCQLPKILWEKNSEILITATAMRLAIYKTTKAVVSQLV